MPNWLEITLYSLLAWEVSGYIGYRIGIFLDTLDGGITRKERREMRVAAVSLGAVFFAVSIGFTVHWYFTEVLPNKRGDDNEVVIKSRENRKAERAAKKHKHKAIDGRSTYVRDSGREIVFSMDTCECEAVRTKTVKDRYADFYRDSIPRGYPLDGQGWMKPEDLPADRKKPEITKAPTVEYQTPEWETLHYVDNDFSKLIEALNFDLVENKPLDPESEDLTETRATFQKILEEIHNDARGAGPRPEGM